MSNFAERIKGIVKEEQERKLAPPIIKEWREKQRHCLDYFIKEKVLNLFEWRARCGVLEPVFINTFSEDIKGIPNAEALTKEILEEIFGTYGIKVTNVNITETIGIGTKVHATLIIE